MGHFAWPSAYQAVMFLKFAGLVAVPLLCARGHPWKLCANEEGGVAQMHCVKRGPPQQEGVDPEGRPIFKRRLCNSKRSWRGSNHDRKVAKSRARVQLHGRAGPLFLFQEKPLCPFSSLLPNSVNPVQLVKALYWFVQRVPFDEARHQCSSGEVDMCPKTLSQIYLTIRLAILKHMREAEDQKIGGPPGEYAVVIDETFFTRKKRARGGFGGRVSRGHQTIVFAGCELHLPTRTMTGRVFLEVIPNRKRATFERMINKYVHKGSLIWTDSHRSYHFLGRPGSGYRWQSINHRRKEFARMGNGVNVGTNAIEGLFGRMKRHFRHLHVTKISKRFYGLYLAEYAFRVRYLHANAPWRDAGFWVLLDVLAKQFKPPVLEEQEYPEGWLEQWEQWKAAHVAPVADRPTVPVPQPLPLPAPKAKAKAAHHPPRVPVQDRPAAAAPQPVPSPAVPPELMEAVQELAERERQERLQAALGQYMGAAEIDRLTGGLPLAARARPAEPPASSSPPAAPPHGASRCSTRAPRQSFFTPLPRERPAAARPAAPVSRKRAPASASPPTVRPTPPELQSTRQLVTAAPATAPTRTRRRHSPS